MDISFLAMEMLDEVREALGVFLEICLTAHSVFVVLSRHNHTIPHPPL